MKRLLLAVITGIALLVAVPVSHVGAQSVNNFTISSYDIKYKLSRDSENRSVLKTVETITAEFPAIAQNRGIERAIPDSYNGHPTSLDMQSITDGSGKDREYSTYDSNGSTVYRIGDPDEYARGTQVYTLTYTQHDVTRFYENTKSDEWYWDTNGTEWKVPIEKLTITTSIDASLADAQKDNAASCYIGVAQSTTRCELVQNGSQTYTTSAQNLESGQNVTLSFGFAPNTFAAFKPSLWMILLPIIVVVSIVTAVIGSIILMGLVIAYTRRMNRAKELHTIPAQYIPPRDTSVTASSLVLSGVATAFTAQLLDFAIRRIISIIETKPASTWKLGEYDIEITSDPSALTEEEKEILSDMFGSLPKVGDRLALSSLQKNIGYYTRTMDNTKKFEKLVRETYQLREKSAAASKYFYRWAIGLLIAGVVLFSAPLLFVALFAWIFGISIRPLTDKGLELRRYLLGLQKYIKASEAERIAFLQGPDTAEKIGEAVDTSNNGQILKLYERVLPYAVLFGEEKKWAKQLEQTYQATGSAPGWYVGTTAFNAAVFSSTLSGFSSASSYSGGYSSSSGGSSGGGSSGGGGGGGGGGGW